MPSPNLTELLRRHGAPENPTVLTLLSATMNEQGRITDADIRETAEATGLPEAAVYGVSTYYDDLRVPRGRRHVRVCTGTACWAATGGAHVEGLETELGVKLGECSEDGEVSLAETVCLGLCHSAPAMRDSETPDDPAEPDARSLLPEPVLTRPGDWSGLRSALETMSPNELLAEVEQADLRGRGGAWFPAGTKWRFTREAASAERVIVVNGDEGDPGSYIDKYLMEQNPALLLEGAALAAYAIGATRAVIVVRSEYPRARPALELAIGSARAQGLLGKAIAGSTFSFDVTVVESAGSYVVGEETALIAAAQGMRGVVSTRPPFPAERGLLGLPTLVHNVETLCNVPQIAIGGADAYRSLSADSDNSGTKLVCFNERLSQPGVVEVPFGMTLRELCEEVAGGLVDGGRIKAVQIGGPLGGIVPGDLLDTPFDTGPLAEIGCMVGHGSIVAFDEKTDVRELARHLLRFGAHESCGTCFPCRIGLKRALEMVEDPGPIDRGRFEELLETVELGSLCGHGTGMPAPLRSLIRYFPDELGLTP